MHSAAAGPAHSTDRGLGRSPNEESTRERTPDRRRAGVVTTTVVEPACGVGRVDIAIRLFGEVGGAVDGHVVPVLATPRMTRLLARLVLEASVGVPRAACPRAVAGFGCRPGADQPAQAAPHPAPIDSGAVGRHRDRGPDPLECRAGRVGGRRRVSRRPGPRRSGDRDQQLRRRAAAGLRRRVGRRGARAVAAPGRRGPRERRGCSRRRGSRRRGRRAHPAPARDRAPPRAGLPAADAGPGQARRAG